MKWLRRISFVVGWALVVTAGWLKGGDDAHPAVLLALLIAGGFILVGRGHDQDIRATSRLTFAC